MYAVQDIRCNPMHPLYGVLYLCRTCRCGLHSALWCTSVYLGASSLQYLRVPQYFYSYISISVERSWWPRIRWRGTRVFQEQGKLLFIGLAARSLFVYCCFSLSHLSFYVLVLWSWGLQTDRVLIALSQPALPTFFMVIVIVNYLLIC